jgi:hypothetical protein
MMMNEVIIAEEGSKVFVNDFDDDRMWISIQHSHGSSHCLLNKKNASLMVEALNKIIEGKK